jgi:hypothetical protein
MIAASSGMCSWTVVAACFAVALPLARRWAAEHGLALAAPHGESDVTRGGRRLLAVALPSAGESSSWLK